MVLFKRHLIVFGGFHDNLRECKYFNDVHAFDLDNMKWKKLEITGSQPCPRSGCVMFTLQEGKIVVLGGYFKEKGKKESEKGTTLSDMYLLVPDSKRFLIHEADPESRPADSDHYFRMWCLYFRPSALFKISQNKTKFK